MFVHVSALPETLLSLRYIAARTLFLFAYNANQAAVVDQNDFKILKRTNRGNLKGMENNLMAALCHPLEVQMNGII